MAWIRDPTTATKNGGTSPKIAKMNAISAPENSIGPDVAAMGSTLPIAPWEGPVATLAEVELGLYSLDWTTVGDAGAARVLDALLEVHQASLGPAFVDAVTAESVLPPEAAVALDELLQLAGMQATERLPKASFGRRLLPDLAEDPLLAVRLDLGRDADLKLFRDFGLFSSAAIVFLRDDDEPEIEIYDGGQAFTFFADEAILEAVVTSAAVPADAINRVV